MRLLFDQNISFRIVNMVSHKFADSKHVSQIGLDNSEDYGIWQFAGKECFTIVTFDSDFYDISLIKGFPPKIIWLRIGNATTKVIADIMILNFNLIKSFILNEKWTNTACLEIHKD